MLCWPLLLLPHLLTVAGHQVRYCDRVYDTLNRSLDRYTISTLSTNIYLPRSDEAWSACRWLEVDTVTPDQLTECAGGLSCGSVAYKYLSISTLYLCYLQGRVCPLQRVVLPRNRVPRAAQMRRHPLQPAAVPQLLAVGGAAVRGRGAAAARGRQSRAAVLGLVAGPVRPRRGLRGQPRPRPRLRGGQVAAGGGRGP